MSRTNQVLNPLAEKVTGPWPKICVPRKFDEAIAVAKRGIELDPLSIPLDDILATAMDKEKLEEYRRIYASSGWSAYPQKRTQEEQERILRRLNQEDHTNLDPVFAVEIYAALGEKDKAFELLDRMYEERNGMLIWLKVDHTYDHLRSDPRFAELVRRVGLPS